MHEHRGIGRGSLHTAVVAVVVVRAVAIVFAVGEILPMPVRHQIGQRHAVVRGDEIDARRRVATAVAKQIARAGKPRGQRAGSVRIAAPETTLIVAKAIVPFGPARRESADEMPLAVPGLGDQLALRQYRIAAHFGQPGKIAVEMPVRIAGNRAGQIEAKAIDADFIGPEAQRIGDQAANLGAVRSKRVAAAAQVAIAPGPMRIGEVVGGIVEPAQRQRRAALVAFAGVVEDHIENDFDAGAMQPFDGIDHG